MSSLYSVSSQYIDTAIKELEENPRALDHSSSLLQRILALDADRKTAYNLALDMFLVGIDTVTKQFIHFLMTKLEHKILLNNRIGI